MKGQPRWAAVQGADARRHLASHQALLRLGALFSCIATLPARAHLPFCCLGGGRLIMSAQWVSKLSLSALCTCPPVCTSVLMPGRGQALSCAVGLQARMLGFSLHVFTSDLHGSWSCRRVCSLRRRPRMRPSAAPKQTQEGCAWVARIGMCGDKMRCGACAPHRCRAPNPSACPLSLMKLHPGVLSIAPAMGVRAMAWGEGFG